MKGRGMVGIVLILFIAAISLMSTAPSAKAASHVVFGPPYEGTKVVLGETSIDGPGFWAESFTTPKAILAWTGTNPSHNINLLMSNDGLHYSNKHMLEENSLWRPAVVFNQAGRGGPYGNIYVAWTGMDPAHTINLETIAMPGFTITKKVTLWGETSFTAPAVTVMNDGVNVVWSGTDPAHTLNIISFSRTGQQLPKHTFWGWNSISRPDISFDAAAGRLLMAWTGRNDRVYFAYTNTSGAWVMPHTSPLVDFTNYAPSMHGIHALNMPVYWLSWTGANHQVFVQQTENFPNWFDVGPIGKFSEAALSGPELAYAGVEGQMLLAWAGTDPLHHLNVAQVFVSH